MPAYHSQIPKEKGKVVANFAILPIRAENSSGTAPRPGPEDKFDIIDEALDNFKSNVFFKHYDVKGPVDRTMIYLTLYIHQCIGRQAKCVDLDDCTKAMFSLAKEAFLLPGASGFPLRAFFHEPSGGEAGQLKEYIAQLRLETGMRLAKRIIDPATKRPSKWWVCFRKRKFMGECFEERQ